MVIRQEHSVTPFGHTSLLSQLSDPPNVTCKIRESIQGEGYNPVKALQEGAWRDENAGVAPLGGPGVFAS
jgi:hypothetical protein